MSRNRSARSTRLAASLAALALAATACTGGESGEGGGDDGDAAEATKAAGDYVAALATWSADLSDAVRTRKPTRTKSGSTIWPELADVLAEAPELDEINGGGDDFEAAEQVADRVDGLVAELDALEELVPSSDNISTHAYDAYLDAYDTSTKLNEENYQDVYAVTTGKLPQQQKDQRISALYLQSMKKELAAKDDYAAEVAKLPAKTVLEKSAVAYMGTEIDWVSGFVQEFIDHLEAEKGDALISAYNTRQAKLRTSFTSAVLTAYSQRGALTALMAADIAELAKAAEAGGLPADAPSVGDAYRATIVSLVKPPEKDSQAAQERLTDQLWMLYRVRELEKTPDEEYADARETLLLQGTGDGRSSYDQLLAVFQQLSDTFPGTDLKPPSDVQPWALEQLAQPVAPLLEPTRAGLERETEAVDIDDSGAYADFVAAAEKLLRTGARTVDDAKKMKAAVAETVEATRPK